MEVEAAVKKFLLPELSYQYDALEPHIDKETMNIHHTKHHQTYTKKLNEAIEGTELEHETIERILANVSRYSMAVRNNAGGYYNHNMFWESMSPAGGGKPTGDLARDIDRTFGSFTELKDKFTESAIVLFGSGWTWLLVDEDGSLGIANTPNQDNPLMDVSEVRGTPILGLDLWEHAYYLKYRNRRPEYIRAWWNVVNWNEVAARYEKVK